MLIEQMKGGWGGIKRITNLKATITEQIKPIKIPRGSSRLELPHEALKHKCQNIF